MISIALRCCAKMLENSSEQSGRQCAGCDCMHVLTLMRACVARCRGQRTWRSTWSGRPHCTRRSNTRPCCTTWKWAAGRTPRHRCAVLICSCSTDLPCGHSVALLPRAQPPSLSVGKCATMGWQPSRLASSDATNARGRAWSQRSSRSYSSCWMSHTPERSPSCSRISRLWASSPKKCCPTGECRISKARSIFAHPCILCRSARSQTTVAIAQYIIMY
jgi:hypothetical protein